MLSRLMGRRPSGAAGQAGIAGRPGFEAHTAVLDGRKVCVFVAPQGTAAAVEMGEGRALVLTGLAAGIVLSDIEEAANGPAAGLGASTSRIGHLTARDADTMIDGLAPLSDGQKDQLRTALSL